VLFADDTNILVSDENINDLQYKLNNVMTELQTWFTQNNLVVNTEKTLAMSYHTTQNKKPLLPQVTFAGRDIPYNTETKFLGIYINNNMKWNVHIKPQLWLIHPVLSESLEVCMYKIQMHFLSPT
jgi:hypothetical protein